MIETIKDSLTRKIIEQSALRYDVEAGKISKVGGFENFVYEFQKDNDDFIIRYVHSKHRTEKEVQAEIEFIDYLSKNGASVSTVVPSINNQITERIDIDDSEYFTVSVFTKAKGTFVKRDHVNDKFYQHLGEELGKMHALTKLYKPKTLRHHYYEETYYEDSLNYLTDNDPVKECQKYIVNKLSSHEKTVDTYGLIHTDLHFGNMFVFENKLTFFDFDDASYQYFISDFAIIIFYHFMHRNISREDKNNQVKFILENVLKGYTKHNTITMTQIKQLNDFIYLRILTLYFVFHSTGLVQDKDSFGFQYCEFFKEFLINKEAFVDLNIVLKDIEQWSL